MSIASRERTRNANSNVAKILKLSDKNFKAVIIKMSMK